MARIEKVNQLIKREISNMILIGKIKDPRIKFVTILTVDVSKDLQHARVRFSTLSDDPADIKNATEGLNSCRAYIRRLLSQNVELRYTPEVQFIYDKSVKYAVEIDQTLEEIKKLKPHSGDADEAN